MPRITRGTATSASVPNSKAASSRAISSTARIRLTVETSKEWWTFLNSDAAAEWQEKDSALYHVQKGVWVLHSYPIDGKRYVHRDSPDLPADVDVVLAGASKQVEPLVAAAWLISHHYNLPEELKILEPVIMARRELVPSVSADDGGTDCLVTLKQAAAMVNRSKRTLERVVSEMPSPRVQGAGGKPSEWAWSEIRPWLEKKYERPLPERFPADRFRPSLPTS